MNRAHQRSGNPGTREDLSRKDGGDKDVCLVGEHLGLQDVLERLITGLGAVQGQQNLGLLTVDVIARHTNDLLVARFGRAEKVIRSERLPSASGALSIDICSSSARTHAPCPSGFPSQG